MGPPWEREAYTVNEVCVLLGCGREPVTQAILGGQIPSMQVGKRYFIPKAAFDRILRQGAKPVKAG
jgi:excisionase family DNA binding protein